MTVVPDWPALIRDMIALEARVKELKIRIEGLEAENTMELKIRIEGLEAENTMLAGGLSRLSGVVSELAGSAADLTEVVQALRLLAHVHDGAGETEH